MGDVSLPANDVHPPADISVNGGQDVQPSAADLDPTIGYRMNHFMLRIRDPKATLNFYVNLMGMQVIWERDMGPFTGYYLGYPQTPEHRADPPKFSKDMSDHSTMCSTPGLLELSYSHGAKELEGPYIHPGHRPPYVGFNHLGFTVPDVKAAVDRLRKAGVKIVKDVGVERTEEFPVTRWEREEKGLALEEISSTFLKIHSQLAFIEDPNGYLIELVPQTLVLPGK